MLDKEVFKASLTNANITTDFLFQVVTNPIVELELVNCGLKASDCVALGSNSNLRTLRRLNLGCNHIGGKGFENLLKEKTL